MKYIDDSDPEGVLEPAFPPRDVTIKRGVDANELYEMLGEVGRGKFGTVYKCREKSTDLKLAAKFVPIPKREDRRNVEREVEIMNSLQHHLIIQLYAAYEYQKMMCVVLELVEGGELFDRVIDDDFILTERVCTVFIRQVCEAMQFIHRNNILHLDLKPENILCLTQEGNRIKIIDFGLARKYDPDKKLQILFGTPEFVAPEVVNFDCITYGTDMWSVGVICYVLISGLSPFMGETDIETMTNVTIAKYDFEDESFGNVSPEAIDFISKLLVKDCSSRMTATQCLDHKWLQRRPRPPTQAAQKITNNVLPPNKLKTSTVTPSPVTNLAPSANDNNELNKSKELETTKDNLKNFIERWEEHPNSPYVFDGDGNVIAPLSETPYKMGHNSDSISSSRACSPSPCESLGTITDDESSNDDDTTITTPVNEPNEFVLPTTEDHKSPPRQGSEQSQETSFSNIKGYLQLFDRRNSDTNYLLGRRASGERVNLADEIRKLSDHLLMLADINTKLGSSDANNNNNEKVSSSVNGKEMAGTSSLTTASAEAAKKGLSTAAATTTTTTTTTSKSSSTVTSSSTKTKTIRSTLSVQLQHQIVDETMKTVSNGNQGRVTDGSAKAKRKLPVHSNSKSQQQQNNLNASQLTATPASASSPASSSSNHNISKNTCSISEAATIRRMKFRVNQLSRDVPIGSPNTHQPVNLEEAANTTKDCLLHLLEKYNESKMRNPLGRHQSISVDWNVRDNLEYRSMSSINAFFQRHNNTGQSIRQLQAQLKGERASSKSTGKTTKKSEQ